MANLAVASIVAPGAVPDRFVVFLHGILGSGANWRTFARQIVAARPRWGALLVDLRLHGDSPTMAPPHTVEAAARDVVTAIAAHPVRAIVGHSFGGKVALEVARQREGDLDHLYIVDATPGARPDARGSESTLHVVELLADLPPDFPDRAAFTAWVEARGVSRPVAMWLAMNVRPVPNTTRFVFRLDVDAIRELLVDYFERDLWSVLEAPTRGPMNTHFVVGGKSDVVDDADRDRARRCPRTTVDVLPDAGHWVHVDAPDALRDLVLGYLDTP
jgi:pimeloyl-ACP methyl ester carboxylesterase